MKTIVMGEDDNAPLFPGYFNHSKLNELLSPGAVLIRPSKWCEEVDGMWADDVYVICHADPVRDLIIALDIKLRVHVWQTRSINLSAALGQVHAELYSQFYVFILTLTRDDIILIPE